MQPFFLSAQRFFIIWDRRFFLAGVIRAASFVPVGMQRTTAERDRGCDDAD